MEFAEVVRRRRMVRAYQTDRPVPREVLERLLSYATHAPSAGFSQGWHFLVLERPADLAAYWATTTSDGDPADDDSWLAGMRSAPVLVIALSDREAYLTRYAEPDKGWTDLDETRWPVPYWHIDTGMASLLMLLGAVDEGLAGCFFGVPPEHHAAVREQFGVPIGLVPVGVVSVGYPATDVRSPSLRRGRRGLDQVVSVGKYGDAWR